MGARRQLRTQLRVMLVVGALVLLALVVAGTTAIQSLRRAQDHLVDQVAVARLAAKDLSVGLLDQETAVRGYTLSGDRAFLEPYDVGRGAEGDATAKIQDLVGDVPDVVDALAAVEQASQAWRSQVAEPAIDQTTTRQSENFRARTIVEGGKAQFDAVRDRLVALDAALTAERDVAADDIGDTTRRLIVVSFTGAAALLFGGVLTTLALRRSVLDPLEAVGRDADLVASGDFTHAVEPSGPEELYRLGEAVEGMRWRVVAELEEVRQAREQVAAKNDELERSNRDLEQFAYVASHDLQEPLRKVAGFCQLLQKRYAGTLDERADEYIHYAVDGAQRMQELISDLLSFSRVGRTTERFELVDLDSVARAAWTQVEAPTDARLEVRGTLPAVAGDAALLRALFANLFANSLKFAGDEPPCVELTTVERDDRWEITVQDNGIGVAPEFADRIFVIFQRLHTRDAYEGTGIGLALCKRIVEFHGGSITLDPSDHGARFTISLPTVDDPETVGPAPEPLLPYRPEGLLR
jgi:signal transduction histidine kinase